MLHSGLVSLTKTCSNILDHTLAHCHDKGDYRREREIIYIIYIYHIYNIMIGILPWQKVNLQPLTLAMCMRLNDLDDMHECIHDYFSTMHTVVVFSVCVCLVPCLFSCCCNVASIGARYYKSAYPTVVSTIHIPDISFIGICLRTNATSHSHTAPLNTNLRARAICVCTCNGDRSKQCQCSTRRWQSRTICWQGRPGFPFSSPCSSDMFCAGKSHPRTSW